MLEDCFQGGHSGFFQKVAKELFPGGRATVMKLQFTNSTLKEKHFSTKKVI